MKKPDPNSLKTNFLSSIIEDTTSIRGRVATLSFQNQTSSSVVDWIILAIDHCQCITLFILANFKIYGDQGKDKVHIIRPLLSLCKLFSPANLLTFDHKSLHAVIVVITILLATIVLRIIILIYVIAIAYKGKNPNKTILLIWQWIFKTQARVIYFCMASTWVNILEAAIKDNMKLDQSSNKILIILSSVMFVLEFIFSFILQTQFPNVIPSKSCLSAKDCTVETLTLVQKFSNQLIRRVLSSYPKTLVWIYTIIALLFSLIKLRHILKYLPAYNLNGLLYQLLGTIVVLCLNLACFCQPILQKYPANMDFVIFLWIILSFLFCRFAANHLQQRYLSLIFNDKGETPEALVHKIILIKHILKKTHLPTDLAEKNKWELLASSTLYQNLSKAFGCLDNSAFENLSALDDQKARNRLFVRYLQRLLVLYPKNHYLHLYTAWFYASKPKLYGLCLKIITELKHVTSWEIKVGTTILLSGAKNKLIHDYQTKTFMFNLSEYVQSTSWLARLKLKIAEQVQFQIDVCQEMNQPSVDLNKISQLGGKIIKTKAQVEVYRRRLSEVTPDYFTEPLVVLAQYYLVVHHSFETYLRYWNNYINKTQKYEKIWASGTFCEENLYNQDTALLVFSADEEGAGKIVYAGGSAEKIFGKDVKGQHISAIVPPILQPKSGAFVKMLLSDGDVPFVNSLINRYFYNINGYMTRVICYLNLNPYAAHSLTYYVIVQPIKTPQETILINEDGGIECFTKNIGKELSLYSVSKGGNWISMICSELVKINHAFNMVLDPHNFASAPNGQSEKKQSPLNSQSIKFKKESLYSQPGNHLTMEEAQELYQLYSGEGRTLILQPIDDPDQYLYKCTVAGIVSNSHVIKFIYLDKIFNENESSPAKRKYSQEEEVTFSEISETYRFQDEKDQGWIDLAKFASDPDPPPTTTYPTLISPLPESTARGLLSLRTTHQDERHTQNYESRTKKPENNYTLSNNEDLQTYSKALSHNKLKQDFKIEGLTALRITRAKRFEKAINSPYYPFIYRVTILMLYVLTILLFALELALSIKIRLGYRNLELAKEVLLHAEARNNFAMDMNVDMTLFLGQATGLFTFSELAYGLTTEYLQAYVKTNLGYVQNANLRLLATTDSLDKIESSLLFEKDIQVSELDFNNNLTVGTNLTTFQATNRIIQTVLKALDLVGTDPSAAIVPLRFCVRNIMNDFLIKGQAIADSFQQSFQEKKNDLIRAVSYYIGGVLLYIGIFLLGFSHVIYKQYQNEVKNLMAFSKISKVAIRTTQSKLTDFQGLLYQSANFESIILQKNNFEPVKTQVAYPLKSRHFSQQNSTANNTESQRQSLIYRNLKKGYYLTLLQSSILGLLVIGMAIGYREFFAKSFRSLGAQVDQLYFIERLNARISLTRNSLFELVALNNTFKVLNEETTTAIVHEINKIETMQNILPDIFPMDELPANSLVSQILYKDACGSLKDDTLAWSYCAKLSKDQENVGLMNMISNLEALFNDLYMKYESSDLSVSSLHTLQIDCFQNILAPVASSVQPLFSALSSSLNDLFVSTSDKGKTMNHLFISVNLFVIVMVCFVLHYFVISKLTRKENDFKQILGIFPANIVLSNFILKSYLMKTSKENFDSIHDDMMQ